MSHCVLASSASKRPRRLPFLSAVLMIAVCGRVLVGQDTDQSAARHREALAVEMKQITECFSALRGEGPDKRPLPLRREPLQRWSDPTQKISEAALWAWGGAAGRTRWSRWSSPPTEPAAKTRRRGGSSSSCSRMNLLRLQGATSSVQR